MDEFLPFAQHLNTLRPAAFRCQATGQHAWKRNKAYRALVNGKWAVFNVCECGTEKKTTLAKDGARRTDYYYPDGYRREAGCGPRTTDLNRFGFRQWMETLPVVEEV